MCSSDQARLLTRSHLARNPWRVMHDGEGCGRYPTQEDCVSAAYRLKDSLVVKIDEATRTVWCVSKEAPVNLKRGGQYAGSGTTG